MKLDLSEIARITGGKHIGENKTLLGISTDTRDMQQGNLFVALVGERFDPHEFILAGKASHAGGLLVERELDIAKPQVVVRNTYVALQSLAEAWREKFKIPVIGITGSNGKTSVKELTRQILETQGEVLATKGNLNNHIGVPLTLLEMNEHHRFAVIEMGANHAGEIASLTQIAKPDIGIVHNIGPAHLEGFGSLEGVARAKAELYRFMNPEGIAVVNADEPYRPLWLHDIGTRKQISFGIRQNADVFAETDDLNLIKISTPAGEIHAELKLLGQHAVYNALAATAVCTGLGVELEDIRAGIESLQPVPGRLVRIEGICGSSVLDDSYNANPASLSVALDVQAREPGAHWLVLGDMGELGAESMALHRKAGIMAKKSGVVRLLGLGQWVVHAVDAFGDGAEHFKSHLEVVEALQQDLNDQVCVLVKGSRAMHMEKVVEGIRAHVDLGGACTEHAA